MLRKTTPLIAALAAFFGTTIGVGIFSLPYAYSNALLTSLLVLVGTGLILMALYSMYIELILEKGIGIHQLPGIVGKVWGRNAKNIVGVILLLGRTGIMFLYTIILADFGNLILSNIFGITVSPFLISGITTLIASIAITKQVKVMSKIELYLSAAIVSIIGITSVLGIASAIANGSAALFPLFAKDSVLDGSTFIGSMHDLGTIYGVSIGALSGIAAIPALKQITKNRSTLIAATRIGTSLVIAIYALFSIYVIVASPEVSADALHGLGDSWWVTLLAVAGFISVLTSYLGVGYSLFEVYHKDYNFGILPSWLFTLIPPLALFISGIDDFTRIAAIIGGVIGGVEGLIILATYWRVEESQRKFPMSKKILTIITCLILSLGLLLAL